MARIRRKPTDAEKAWNNFSKLQQRLYELTGGVDYAGGIHQILRRQPEQNQRIFAERYRALAEQVLRQVEEFERQKQRPEQSDS